MTTPSTPASTVAITPTTNVTVPNAEPGVIDTASAPATTTAPTTPTTTGKANTEVGVAPVAPGQGKELSDLTGGWSVHPDQVKAFAAAVHQVRADLDAVFKQVDQLTSPAYLPQLGSSPVGQALTAKFVDRLSGGSGLLPNLSTVLNHLDQFVRNAEQAASGYQDSDESSAGTLKSL
jgi:hypothetical protein